MLSLSSPLHTEVAENSVRKHTYGQTKMKKKRDCAGGLTRHRTCIYTPVSIQLFTPDDAISAYLIG